MEVYTVEVNNKTLIVTTNLDEAIQAVRDNLPENKHNMIVFVWANGKVETEVMFKGDRTLRYYMQNWKLEQALGSMI